MFVDGRLVNRLDKHFGDLFRDEFYKVKFKKPRAIFEFVGVLNLSGGVEVNFLGTTLRRNRAYYAVLEMVREAMRRAKPEQGEEEEGRRGAKSKS